ncbi:MAG: CBS domain-containing protein [Candidatus Wallbacteria bacterium]|nr:CBS domain-containing protein [Candidatus Wallbacteria bacterium]
MSIEQNLRTQPLSLVLRSDPAQVSPGTRLTEAIATMRDAGFGCVLVAVKKKLVGIFTERDLLHRVLGSGAKLSSRVGEFMTKDPATLGPQASIAEAIVAMDRGGYRHIPIVDRSGRPVGIVSVKDVTDFIVEHYPVEIYNLPPDPGKVSTRPEGG